MKTQKEIQRALKFRADTTRLARKLLRTRTVRGERIVRKQIVTMVLEYYNLPVPEFK